MILPEKMTDQEVLRVATVLAIQYEGKIDHLKTLIAMQADRRLDQADVSGFSIWKRIEVALNGVNSVD